MNITIQDLSGLYSGADSLKRALRIVLFAVFAAASAQLAVRLPLTPVPVTMQTLFVALAGIMLGSRDGFYSMAVYIVLGTAGLPWFANFSGGPMVLAGPTGGYLVAFPFAAWLAGKTVESFRRGAPTFFLAAILSSALIIFSGAVYLSTAFPVSISTVFALGVTPFIGVELFKAFIAAVIVKRS